MQSVYQAIQNGADAVYFAGKNFGARAFAANFTYDEMKQAIDYAHLYGAKAYITLNTLVYENEISEFLKHAERVYKLGADALIMQDIGMMSLLYNRFPDTHIHASTQSHNHSDESLYFVRELGASRAVLAREMDIAQIKSLECDIEKEAFIHGALCICYSGQCLMSALTKGRSGNRGECAQSCRMRYRLLRGGEYVKTEGEYLLSPKDVALFEDAASLADAGVCCFKIEGRMKSPEYVGHVTKIYSKLLKSLSGGLPLYIEREDMEKLEKLFNRGFTKGHLFGKRGGELMGTLRPNHKGVPLGYVLSLSKDRIRVKLAAPLNQGDGIKFEKSDTGFICNRIYKNGRLVSGADRGDVAELDCKAEAAAGESVVKTSDIALLKGLQNPGSARKVMISGLFIASAGEPVSLEITDDGGHSIAVTGDIVQPSRTSPTSERDIEQSLNKLTDTPFAFGKLRIDCGGDIFIAKSAVNSLRREAVMRLTQERIRIKERSIVDYVLQPVRRGGTSGSPRLHVLVRTPEQFEAVKDMPAGDIYTGDTRLYFDRKCECKRLRLKTDRLAKRCAPYLGERLLVTDHGGIYSYRNGNDFVIDYTVWALNSYSVSYLAGLGASRISLSPELNEEQTEAMINAYTAANGQAPPVEAVVYARYELMAMRHCVISENMNCGSCKKFDYALEDIGGGRFPIVADENCNNYILSSKRVEADVQRLLFLGVKDFRVELLDEDADKSRGIVQRFLNTLK